MPDTTINHGEMFEDLFEKYRNANREKSKLTDITYASNDILEGFIGLKHLCNLGRHYFRCSRDYLVNKCEHWGIDKNSSRESIKKDETEEKRVIIYFENKLDFVKAFYYLQDKKISMQGIKDETFEIPPSAVKILQKQCSDFKTANTYEEIKKLEKDKQ